MALPASRATGNSSRVSFWQSGHSPTLLSAFLYFNFTFMVWVLLGPLAVQIAADLHLNPAQQGLLVATPLLAGALLRVALGMLADRVQPRLAGAIGQAAVIVALVIGWLMPVTTFADTLVLGVLIGVAGASFAAALQLAACWYPPEHKGTALGIAGAGNFGTVILNGGLQYSSYANGDTKRASLGLDYYLPGVDAWLTPAIGVVRDQDGKDTFSWGLGGNWQVGAYSRIGASYSDAPETENLITTDTTVKSMYLRQSLTGTLVLYVDFTELERESSYTRRQISLTLQTSF